MKVIYQTASTAIGGRDGHVKSTDGILDMDVRLPKELGGQGGEFTNPEQLFSAGYAACFDNAIIHVAKAMKHEVSSETTVTVCVVKTTNGIGFAIKIDAKIDGVDRETAKSILEEAHATCPYSKATRGNVEQEVNLI